MAYSGEYGREPGARRKKFAGYLKAANELRQTYFSADHQDGSSNYDIEDGTGFPHASVARNESQEMILFPSYAKTHVDVKIDRPLNVGGDSTDEEYWRSHRYQDKNSVVDVDVRGWIYTPQRGQTTRKQRLMIGVAKQMSGLPLSSNNKTGEPGSSVPSSRASSPTRAQEEELIKLETEEIMRNGQREQRYADRGAFSEQPGAYASTDGSGDTPQGNAPSETLRHRASIISTVSSQDDESLSSHRRRSSWQAPAKMTVAELEIANKHLFTRLRPFMANAVANAPIKVFFYNDVASRQHTIFTDSSGHFTFRTSLDFIPTHVRVLAGEQLSVTEQVIVTSAKGVSLISDIDDTVKHSAVTAGAREIFRTAFIRELGDLTIEGVREWYTKMHDMGVKLHYVSNSPWQMYPILTTYFKLAHLPKGSFHLKQYTGMFQGIFEPAAERKKPSLDKLMRDFPDRKFILVGDSGEADLEVYTDVALENPGKILGIFIRDVTTTPKTGYFDSNIPSSGSSTPRPRNHPQNRSSDSLAMSKKLSRPDDIRNDEADLEAAVAASLQDMEEEARKARRSINPDAPEFERLQPSIMANTKPRLPPRPPSNSANSRLMESNFPMTASPEEDLIDFTQSPSRPWLAQSSQTQISSSRGSSTAPVPPRKPIALRATSPGLDRKTLSENGNRPAPPPPRKPYNAAQSNKNTSSSPPTGTQNNTPSKAAPPPLPERRRAQLEAETQPPPPPVPYRRTENPPNVRSSLSRPVSQISSQHSSPLARPIRGATSFEDFNLPASAIPRAGPPPPPRRAYASSSSANSLRAERLSGAAGGGGGDDGDTLISAHGETLTKKEFMWQQRWERAKDMLERKGVTLRTWRVGDDVAGVCTKLVEMALRDMERGGGKK